MASGALGCTDGDVIVQLKLNTLDNDYSTGYPGGALGAYSDYSSTVGLDFCSSWRFLQLRNYCWTIWSKCWHFRDQAPE
ncbi:MAG: hypothetical protein V9H26_12985 [Verrucomicrobiota bacterium]